MSNALKNVVKLSDYYDLVADGGAVGDGVTDNASIINAAASLHPFVPTGVFKTSAGATTFPGVFSGLGQIKTPDGNLRGKTFMVVGSAPSSLGTHTSITTAFNGDLSNSFLQVEQRITGAATLGTPVSGFQFTPELIPIYLYLQNQSGHNESLSGNGGRTAAGAIRIRGENQGQGGVLPISTSVFVNATLPSSTSFLANPSAAGYNAETFAGADGVYLNPFEVNCDDQGFDAAGIGAVVNLMRANNTGAKDATWGGFRVSSNGSKPIDVGFLANGKAQIGIDLSSASFQTSGTWNRAALTLSQDQRIYLNASGTDAGASLYRLPSSTGTTYIHYGSGASAIVLVVGNQPSLQVGASQVTVNCSNGINVATGVYRLGGTQVVGDRDTGWTAMTGSTDKVTSYATSTVTLAQLAGRVMAMQAALTTHGLLGA